MLALAAAGTAALEAVVEGFDDRAAALPSHLPGWSRAHVVSHLARDAETLAGLLVRARTGVEAPMSVSAERRDRDVEEGARRGARALCADLVTADRGFARACAQLPEGAWQAVVRVPGADRVPAAEVVWMRAREVWVHAVDLLGGVTFADVPRQMITALLDAAERESKTRPGHPLVELRGQPDDGIWLLGCPGSRVAAVVAGDAPSLAAYVTGRPVPGALGTMEGRPPLLPNWL